MSIDYEISRVRSNISQAQSINYQLRSELNELTNGVNRASENWYKLTNRINNVLSTGANLINDSHEITLKAYELEGQVEKIYALYKNIETANKNIRACKNKIYYEFNNYRAVRKIVEAMLNNIEVSFVSDKTLMKSIEREHLQLPDYWLTCALLAIMAWKKDDREMADKALKRACQLDMNSTSIFFFAFHLRIDKNETALKWFESYIHCTLNGEDRNGILLVFSVLCSTVKKDVSNELIDKADKFLNSIMVAKQQSEDYDENEMVNRIMCCLNNYKTSQPIDYPILMKHCTEKTYLENQLNDAKTNCEYLNLIKGIITITNEERNNFLNKFIDDLVEKTNQAEKEISREILYNEYVISCQGDIEAAKQSYDEYIRYSEDELNIINEMVESIYHPTEEIGAAERRKMFIMTKALHRKAIENKVNEYRSRFKRTLKIKIDDYESEANFTSEENEMRNIERYFSDLQTHRLSAVKMWPCFIFFGAAVLSAVAAIFLKFPILLVLTAAGIAAGVLKIITTNRTKVKIAKECTIQLNNTRDTCSKIYAEFRKYEEEYKAYDKYYEDIEAEFSKI